MDGEICTREIRKLNPSIPIIAITADCVVSKEWKAAGVTDVLGKPFSQRDLINMLVKYCNDKL
jgi:CheY-like chemotaxis protein